MPSSPPREKKRRVSTLMTGERKESQCSPTHPFNFKTSPRHACHHRKSVTKKKTPISAAKKKTPKAPNSKTNPRRGEGGGYEAGLNRNGSRPAGAPVKGLMALALPERQTMRIFRGTGTSGGVDLLMGGRSSQNGRPSKSRRRRDDALDDATDVFGFRLWVD